MNDTGLGLIWQVELHRSMAQSYFEAYQKQDVQKGQTYDNWIFSDDATYWSPYFGDEQILLKTHPMSVKDSASMEAAVYTATLPDWGPLDFEVWPSPDGFAMKSHFGGHDENGKLWDFFAYGFVKTNREGQITHWETHVSPEYNDFLDKTIGVHGPFKSGADEYMQAVMKKMSEAGVQIPGVNSEMNQTENRRNNLCQTQTNC